MTDWGTKPADPQVFAENRYYVVYSCGVLDDAPDGTTRALGGAARLDH